MNLTCKLRYCPGCDTQHPSRMFSWTRNGYATRCKNCGAEKRAKKASPAQSSDVVRGIIEALHARDLHITRLERNVKEARAGRDKWKEAALRYQKTIIDLRKELREKP